LPISAVQLSPNSRGWEKLSSYEIDEISFQAVDSIVEEIKRNFPDIPGLLRVSAKRKNRLASDFSNAMLTYSDSIREEIAINSEPPQFEYRDTIEYLLKILELSLKIDEEHVYHFESYRGNASDNHLLSRAGQTEILNFIVHLSCMIRKPRGRRSNYAVNNAAEPCITAIERFIGSRFPRTIGASVGEFTTREAQIFFFMMRKIEKNITSSAAHTALKHAIAWRKKLGVK
jgi:hypothetical protein